MKTAFRKCTKQQLGAGKKAAKRKAQPRNNSLPPGQKAKTFAQQRKAGKRVFRKVNNGFCALGVLRMNKIYFLFPPLKPPSPKDSGENIILSVTSQTAVRSNFTFRELEMNIWTWHVLSCL